jgi:AcrR family transcriptional regulator
MRTKQAVVEEFRCQAIREAAVRVVARKGLSKVTVQDIADEAGVAKGTVYLYFKSREEILETAMGATLDELRARLRAAAEGARDKIEAVVATQLRFFDERRDFVRLYVTTAEPFGERRLRKHDCYLDHIAQLREMLGVDERTAIGIAAVLRDIGLQRVTEKKPRPIEEDIAFVRDFITRGIRTEKRS